ncbi:MAG TPA: hypothetical protein VK116_09610, partial [Planctomycetota bacterium]|nr:hypothetical protein [Planctomycetota bacterium]
MSRAVVRPCDSSQARGRDPRDEKRSITLPDRGIALAGRRRRGGYSRAVFPLPVGSRNEATMALRFDFYRG